MTDLNEPIILEDKGAESRWELFKTNCPKLSDWGLTTLQTGLEAYAKSMVLDPNYLCKDHRNSHSHFYSKKFKEHSSVCMRAHFFDRTGVKKSDLLDGLASLQDNYIGYSVIRPVSERCLGRTVIDPYRVGRKMSDGFYVLRTKFKSHLNGPALDVSGYP